MPPPVSLGRRVLATAVDLAFVAGVVGLGVLREHALPFDGLFTCLGFGLAGISWLLRDTGGASPGKKLARLVVRRADGERVDAATSARRNAALGVGMVLTGAGTLLIADPFAEALAALATVLGGVLCLGAVLDAAPLLIHPERRRRNDRWAGTHVERASAQRGSASAAP